MAVRLIKTKSNRKKQRVCAYTRVSTTNSSQLDSLENQKAYFENLYTNQWMSIFSVFITTREFLDLRQNGQVFKLCLKLVGKVRLI